MVTALRWRQPGQWNMFVGDRSALFAAMTRQHAGSLGQRLTSACAPLETRLRAIIDEMRDAWKSATRLPSWRLDQVAHPLAWNVYRLDTQDPTRSRCWCRIGFVGCGLVGVDVKSHQVGPPCPYPAIVAGNEAQDAFCDSETRALARPHDVDVPSGGDFAAVTYDGRLITTSIAAAVRRLGRAQAHQAWCERPVQGHVARLASAIYGPAIDIRAYTKCKWERRWTALSLPQDTSPDVDLSGILFRTVRAIGGAWTERLHVDPEALRRATRWAAEATLPSPRTCPLCKRGHGTPRHVFMQCPAVAKFADATRDMVEAELLRHASGEVLVASA